MVLAIAVVVSALDDRTGELVPGTIYSTAAGDPFDVAYGIDESGMGCISLGGLQPSRSSAFSQGRQWRRATSGLFYGGSRVNCIDPDELDEGGTYQLVLPAAAEKPALVVGVMPAGATGAVVGGVGRETTRAEARGRWFLASLEPAAPSLLDLATIRVEFDR